MKFGREIASFLFLAAACGDNGSTTVTTAPTTMTGVSGSTTLPTTEGTTSPDDPTIGSTSAPTSAPPTTGTMEDGGPVFLSFNTNVSQITEGESLTFTAILTDPDGADDIIGGSLLSDDESIDYAPFVAAGQPGTYSLSLSWAQIHQAEPIQFENDEPSRVFRGRFFDQAGHKAVDGVDIGLVCAGGSACGGACTDVAAEGDNCGTCGHACAAMACEGGGCAPSFSPCFTYEDGMDTCVEICQSIGETCAENQCDGATRRGYDLLQECRATEAYSLIPEPCDQVQSWLLDALQCCCTDSN